MCCGSCSHWFSSGRLLWASCTPRCLLTKLRQLRHQSCLFSALRTRVVKLVFSLLMRRPNQARQPHGALRAASRSGLRNQDATGALECREAFPLPCRTHLGLKRLLCGQESPNLVLGHRVCWLLHLRDGGKRGGGRFSHVRLKYSLQSLITNVKVICEPKEGEALSWWVGNVVASVAAPGYHLSGAKCCAWARVLC